MNALDIGNKMIIGQRFIFNIFSFGDEDNFQIKIKLKEALPI